jgi:hypothetical protein
VRYCLFCLLVEPISGVDLDKLPSFEERKDFIFIGNFYMNPTGMQFSI